MAETPSSPATQNSNPNQIEQPNPTPQSNQPDSVPQKQQSQPTQSIPPPPPPSIPMSVNSSPNPPLVSPPPPSVSYTPPPASYAPVMLPSVPSFRPFPQFTPFSNPAVPNPNFQNPSVQTSSFQPPGVTAPPSMAPVAVSGALGSSGTAATSVPPQPLMSYQVTAVGQPPNPALRPYAPMPNGYTPLPGLPRYAPPYPMMLRPGFPPRPGAMGVMPPMARPSIPVIPGVRPMIPPVIRPVVPSVTPAEKPQTTVYVGKIAPSVENDFMLSLLQLCGPVKSWKRAQDPSNGTPRGFGFCEFESAEGVLRALRLLSKLNIDWQELVLNVNQATREYLERYVEKKVENSKNVKENEAATAEKENVAAEGVEKNDISNPSIEESKEGKGSVHKENDTSTFGIVTEEDREADREAREKLTSMIEERLKTKPPPPPPPPPPAQVSVEGGGGSEVLAKPKDVDSDADLMRNDAADEKNDDDTTSDTKQGSEHDRPETSSPDRSRRDRRSRDRDRERDLKREKEREIERYERETERERIRKEREQRRKIEDAERQYGECLKDWEYRERDKEKQRQYEKEREKEKESKRKKEIFYEEEDEDDDSRKRWRRSVLEDRRKKRLREREDDLADRQKEEEEIAEAMRRAEEENKLQQQKFALKDPDEDIVNESEKEKVAAESSAEYKDKSVEQNHEGYPDQGDGILQNGRSSDELNVAPVAAVDNQQSSNATTKKLGFGLVGSGKRTSVPSVFHEEDDEDARKEKRMRPLVPIDYSTEELQAVQLNVSGAPQPNLAAAAEFAKRISSSSKEERSDSGKERNRRTSDRSSQRERERNDEDFSRPRDENKEDHVTDREHGVDRLKPTDNKKLLDAKQLIDMIPRTKEELFSYEINWVIYDKHGLHERMRPWISKKITEFLGEEEKTLVDYIVSSTQEHLEAERMLQLLQSILDEEAEMFVLKMWRMLIFEIKKVETGLASTKPKS